jgi:probable metal-binding protein
MENQIHGHDVLDFMIASGVSYTRATLTRALDAKFGASARFHTCSADNMTAGQLIDFLSARGKFRGTAEAFTVDSDRVCQH